MQHIHTKQQHQIIFNIYSRRKPNHFIFNIKIGGGANVCCHPKFRSKQSVRRWGDFFLGGGGSWVLDYITEKDWLENFFSLTRSWPGRIDKGNKQHSSIPGFHLYAKMSVAERLRQQFHHATITYCIGSVQLLIARRPGCQAARQIWQEDGG